MSNSITVGIAGLKYGSAPVELVTYALGSCVGVCLYDPVRRIGGLAHIVLPGRPPAGANELRYAETCIPLMVKGMEERGCLRSRMTAKIAGGARMFAIEGEQGFDIGVRNVAAVREGLRGLGIAITAEETGLNFGRTVYFQTENGGMRVRSFTNGTKIY